jgi:hypothetical protein
MDRSRQRHRPIGARRRDRVDLALREGWLTWDTMMTTVESMTARGAHYTALHFNAAPIGVYAQRHTTRDGRSRAREEGEQSAAHASRPCQRWAYRPPFAYFPELRIPRRPSSVPMDVALWRERGGHRT